MFDTLQRAGWMRPQPAHPLENRAFTFYTDPRAEGKFIERDEELA